MESVILVIHLILALAIVILVLIQRSEGGGLGIGGSSGGGMGGFMTARGAANLLTRATGICAALFFITSLTLGILAGAKSKSKNVFDALPEKAAVSQMIAADAKKTSTEDTKPEAPVEEPSVPIAE